MHKSTKLKAFIKELYDTWTEERPSTLAAALAYFGLFSIAPLIYTSITLAGILVDEVLLEQELFTRIEYAYGEDIAQFIKGLVEVASVDKSEGSIIISLISFIILLYAASVMFYQLQYALNRIWDAPTRVAPTSTNGILSFIKNRLIVFVGVIGIGIALVIAMLFNIVYSNLYTKLNLSGSTPLINLLFLIGIGTLYIAMIYKVLPNVNIAWRDVWIGAFVTSILVAIGAWLIGLFIRASSFSSAIEAAGVVAIILIGFFYVANIFLFGALFTKVYASVYGSKIKPEIPKEIPH